MAEWKPLNMEVRSWVIAQTLRLEKASSDALKAIFRMVKENSNSLGNKSSALSFKSKIDLLYDLEEISKEYYNHLIKILEIRNQFAHNPDADSFESFDKINPDINKYLLKQYEPPSVEVLRREEILKKTFCDLFTKTVARISVLEFEYLRGIDKDYRKHINNQIVENIEIIWKKALTKKKSRKEKTPSLFFMKNTDKEIEDFYNDFIIEINEHSIEVADNIKDKGLIEIIKGKETTRETLLRLKKNKKS